MCSDGQYRRCSDKALLMHHLEKSKMSISQESLDQTCILFDEMAVVKMNKLFAKILSIIVVIWPTPL